MVRQGILLVLKITLMPFRRLWSRQLRLFGTVKTLHDKAMICTAHKAVSYACAHMNVHIKLQVCKRYACTPTNVQIKLQGEVKTKLCSATSLDDAIEGRVPDVEIDASLPCQKQAPRQGLTVLQAQTLQGPGCQSVWQTVLWSLQSSTAELKVECA